MPHLILEYSANLESDLEIGALLRDLHEAAAGCPTLERIALRSRAVRRDHVVVADGNPEHRFAMVTARILKGRADDVKQEIADTLFATLKAGLEQATTGKGLALAVDVVEIELSTFRKDHNLAERIRP